MPLNLASPGIVVREVDLTVGRVNSATNKTAAIVAPFVKGPTESPTVVETENDLLNIFGAPQPTDKHYEHWLTASSYLAYGGSLLVVRSDDNDLRNAYSGSSATAPKIKSIDHYNQLGYDENTINGITFVSKNPGSWANGIKVALIDSFADQIITLPTTANYNVGYGVTQSFSKVIAGVGTTSVTNGYLKGIVTGVGVAAGLSTNQIAVKVLSTVINSTEVGVDYQQGGSYAFSEGQIGAIDNSGLEFPGTSFTVSNVSDWFDSQTISISTVSSISWNNIAPRPSTSEYGASRGSKNDEVHVVVIDALGSITGNVGTILEKHLSLSKASDAEFSVGSPSNWRKYLVNNSQFIFAGSSPSGVATAGFTTSYTLATDIGWDQEANGIKFAVAGNQSFNLSGGVDYNGQAGVTTSGSLTAPLSKISDGYSLFESSDTYKIDFLLMGSANYPKETAQALANKLIEVAELRKDAIAFITPYRGSALTDTVSQTAVTVNSDEDITNNVISFYSSVTSSSYSVFDSGYKYMYDRFSNVFRYVPLNGDIAGLCARTDINQFPWYSPAGTARGSILNAVKLAYNPTKSQRDRLYSNRVNPVIFASGSGIVLFGDKTGLAKSSAFDRINVRRLFIYLENAITAAAKDQLFEFNDEITRTNFVNIVEPFLRDVKAKRGVYDYVVVCDETNNTAAVIDNNEFVADIYIKPARSINFIGLTFIATRTGVSFEEVIGQF